MHCPSRRWRSGGRGAGAGAGRTRSSYRFSPTLIGFGPMRRRIVFYSLVLVVAGLGSQLAAQRSATDSSVLTVDRIFASPEFRAGTFGPLGGPNDGGGYTPPERAGTKGGKDIVRYDIETAGETMLPPARRRLPPGRS